METPTRFISSKRQASVRSGDVDGEIKKVEAPWFDLWTSNGRTAQAPALGSSYDDHSLLLERLGELRQRACEALLGDSRSKVSPQELVNNGVVARFQAIAKSYGDKKVLGSDGWRVSELVNALLRLRPLFWLKFLLLRRQDAGSCSCC